jgi:nitroimidazol reductase NimA-like FMN-containing flavoprotein (pyridoxamine 5'-phosphate oxidase superfamily)
VAHLADLGEEACRSRLAQEDVGRIAFVDNEGYPVVFPVNYRVHDERIVFRTGEGLKLQSIPLRHVAFEIDRFDPTGRTGWSLLVRGFAREVTTALGEPYESLRSAPLASWAGGAKEHWVAVEIHSITGRQIVDEST